MTTDLKQLRAAVNKRLHQLEVAREQVKTEKTTLSRLQSNAVSLRSALLIAQAIAQKVQEEAHARIATIVTQALQAVFGEEEAYIFKIKFEQKRGRTEAQLVFGRNTLQEGLVGKGIEIDPMTASGGGVVDVAAFALRLSCMLLSKPPVRRLLVLDEPMKFLSQEYRQPMAELIQKLAKELDVQIIMVSHIEDFKIGKVVQL